jgi:hypothetical protein
MRNVSYKLAEKSKTGNYPKTSDWSVHRNFKRISIHDIAKRSKKKNKKQNLPTYTNSVIPIFVCDIPYSV